MRCLQRSENVAIEMIRTIIVLMVNNCDGGSDDDDDDDDAVKVAAD